MGLIDDKKRAISELEEERAVLVGLITPEQSESRAQEYLDELAFLATTAGATTVKTFTQKTDAPNRTTFVGKGKL
ncbi:MAG: GTPase HflX, partial [Muribaculaceae bacterium]|nr:GTPase HflX [Muribaculaceae bacterium]